MRIIILIVLFLLLTNLAVAYSSNQGKITVLVFVDNKPLENNTMQNLSYSSNLDDSYSNIQKISLIETLLNKIKKFKLL